MLKIAIQMDAVETLKPQTDSTLLLGIEAQRRGYELCYYTPDRLSARDGVITARATRVTLHAGRTPHYDIGETAAVNLRDMDVILLRQDPPFDMAYLSITYILEQLAGDVLVVNDPASVRNHPEKIFPGFFAGFMPPTLISADAQAIEEFRREHEDIVIKPLYGFAGHDVVHLRPGDDLDAMLETALGERKLPLMAQPFLPEVKTGDRRIIFIDGKVAGIMARIPPEDDFRANFRVGGHAEVATMTPRQREICEALGPELKKRGLIFAGIDCIGDWLTEINVTSPTGMVAMNKLYGLKLEADFWDAVEARL